MRRRRLSTRRVAAAVYVPRADPRFQVSVVTVAPSSQIGEYHLASQQRHPAGDRRRTGQRQPQIIAKHYDVAGDRERLEERRRPYIDQLDIVSEDIETEESSPSSTFTANQGKSKGQDGDGGI